MIDTFFYPHLCSISRSTGKTDDEGNEIFTTIYDGACGVQIGSNGDTALQGDVYQRSPTIILPVINIAFLIGDLVVATVENGKILEYTVKSERVSTETEVSGTTLWLKKGSDV